jgi:two-component system nitrate/nitrite response regulator NarL
MSGTGKQALATVLIGPSDLYREGLAWVLEGTDIHIVASASQVDDLVLDPALQHEPLLLLIDAGGSLDAVIRQIELFKQRHPAARVAVLAASERFDDMVSLCRAGANAYLARGTTSNILTKSLELVMLGETLLPAGALRNIPALRDAPNRVEGETSDTRRLSAQERSVLRDLADGRTNKDIATRNDMALASVANVVKTVFRKIGARNRTQAAIWTVNNLPPDGGTESRSLGPRRPTVGPSSPGETADGERAGHGELCGGEAPPRRVADEIGLGVSIQDETKSTIRNSIAQQGRTRGERRPVAEEEEHLAAMSCRLRELGEAGSFAASAAVGSCAP